MDYFYKVIRNYEFNPPYSPKSDHKYNSNNRYRPPHTNHPEFLSSASKNSYLVSQLSPATIVNPPALSILLIGLQHNNITNTVNQTSWSLLKYTIMQAQKLKQFYMCIIILIFDKPMDRENSCQDAILKDIQLNMEIEEQGEPEGKFEECTRKSSENMKSGSKDFQLPLQVKFETPDRKMDDPKEEQMKGEVSQPADTDKNEKTNQKQARIKKEAKLQGLYAIYLRNQKGAKNRQETPVGFLEYFRIKNQESVPGNKGPIHLNLCSLQQILQLTTKKQIIPYEIYLNYQSKFHESPQKIFLSRLSKNLNNFDFQKIVFCPVDHRLLTDYLVWKYPSEFVFNTGSIATIDHLATNFYIFLYKLTNQQYYNAYEQIRWRFNRHWMPKASKVRRLTVENETEQNELFTFSKPKKLRNM